MDQKHRKMFLEWAKTDIHKRRVEEARRIILRYANTRFYVAVSGGKDSLSLLHLVAKTIEDKEIHVFHWDHGSYLMPREVERDIVECIKAVSPRIVLHILSSRKLEDPRARWDYVIWYRTFYGKLRSFTRKHGFRIAFLGLREEESITRRNRASKIAENKDGVLLVYPLHAWTYMDVWAYIVSNNIRYPKIYDKIAEITGYDKARLVTFYDKEFEQFGNLEISKFILPKEKR